MSIATHRNPWQVRVIVSLLLGLWALPAFTIGGPGSRASAQGPTDVVEVTDQPVQGGTVTVNRVVAAQDGWIVIHVDSGGRPGPVLGQTAVTTGENMNVPVTLSRDVPVNAALWAMLHIDAGTKGTYEFPGPDQPVFLNNQVVQTKFTVTSSASPSPSPSPSPESQQVLPQTGAEDGLDFALLLELAAICLLLGMGMRLRRVDRGR